MRCAKFERCSERRAQSLSVQWPYGCKQGNVWKVFHARVRASAGHRVGVELLRDVGFDRIQAQFRRRDSGKCEHVVRSDNLGRPNNKVAKCDIDAEVLTVELASQATLRAKSQPLILHAVVLDCRLLWVAADFEGHEVAE